MLKKIAFAILLILGIGLTIGGLLSLGGDETGAMIFMTVVGIVLILISSKPLFSDKKTKDEKAAKPGKNVDEQMARQVAEQIKNKSSDASGLLKNVENEESRRETLSYAIKMVVDEFLEDNLLSEEEEETINHFLDNAGYSTNALNAYGGITDLLKASALRSVMNGDIPENVPEFQMPIRFNFLKSETLIWAFGDVDYYKEVTRRHYEGGHQGFSVRVAKGLYYRTGAFKGRPVEEKKRGIPGYRTNGPDHQTYLLRKLQHHVPRPLQQNRSRHSLRRWPGLHERPQKCKNLLYLKLVSDGWFAYNLAVNLAQQME